MKCIPFVYAVILLLLASSNISCQPSTPEQPNIVWITAEDMSPVLGYLGDAYAITPHIDRLSEESVIYTHAYATSPVCSPSRAALINGVMASAQGAHQMRSTFPLPAHWTGFPALLREAGYYTTNNVKTDYNSGHADAIIAASWDESSDTAGWQGRQVGQSFFSIYNFMTSHQSRTMVWPYEQFQAEVQDKLSPEEIHDPADAPVPPYYPDTPIVRKTIARFYDSVTAMDKQVGEVLERLEAEGLLDDTIVFFYSDHGSGMPRHKRALLDTGMHVPLLIRFPEKYQHLAPAVAGTRLDRLVDFSDFGPTVLSLTGIDVPGYMQGEPFLGSQEATPRDYVYGHKDRVDEIMDMARSVRDKQYHYVRNYMPHLGYNQQGAFIDQGEIRHEFYRMAEGEMTDAQRHFAGPTRPLEELYDGEADPLNLNNLAGSPAHQEVLSRMREALNESLMEKRDLGFMPETELWKQIEGTTPYDWAQTDAYDIAALKKAAEAVGRDDFTVLRGNLQHEDPGVRYWGAMGYTAASSLPSAEVAALREALNDPAEIVRIEAATALLHHGHEAEGLETLIEMLGHEDLTVVLYAARAIELGGEKSKPAYGAMKALYDKYESTTYDPEWFIKFSTEGFLNRVEV